MSTFSWDFTVTLSNSTTSTLFLLLLKVMFLHIHDTKQTTLWITLSNNVGWQTGGYPIQSRVTFLSRRLLVEPSLVSWVSCSACSDLAHCFVCLQNYANLFILNLETSTENKNTSWRVLHLSSGKFGKRERPLLSRPDFTSHHGLLTCSWCSEVPFKQSQQISVNVGSWGIPSKKRWRKYQTKHLVPRQQI